jgi:hypothetical protein
VLVGWGRGVVMIVVIVVIVIVTRCPCKVLGAVLFPRARIMEQQTLKVRTEPQHSVPISIRRAGMFRMEGEFEGM